MLSTRTIHLALVALTPLCASGQAFNIELGPSSSALPTSSYGAVAGQTGLWTRGLRLGSALTDVNGNLTTATFAGSGIPASLSGVPNTSADEKLFMSTAYLLDSGASNYATIGGLASGWYDVYLYCWTGTSVNGANPLISIGTDSSNFQATPNCVAPWPGQQTLGITYVKFTLRVQQPGTGIGIVYGLAPDRVAALSGIQIVPVPTPGAAGLLTFAALGAARRRR